MARIEAKPKIIITKPSLLNVSQFLRKIGGYSTYITEPFKLLKRNEMMTLEQWNIVFNDYIGGK